MTIKISLLIGPNLNTRFKGACIREQIVEGLQKGKNIELDFSEIETMSSSFADECFAKLIFSFDYDKINAQTKFRHTTPFLRSVIKNAYNERRGSDRRISINNSSLVF
jgi:hypothetical protein